MLLKPPPPSPILQMKSLNHLPDPQSSLHVSHMPVLPPIAVEKVAVLQSLPLPAPILSTHCISPSCLLKGFASAIRPPKHTHSPASQCGPLLDHSYQETNKQPSTFPSLMTSTHTDALAVPHSCQAGSCHRVFALPLPIPENMLFPDLSPISERSSLSTPSKAVLHSAISFYCLTCFLFLLSRKHLFVGFAVYHPYYYYCKCPERKALFTT